MSAKRVDNNHAEIVRGLRQVGCSVLDMHELGHGAPDLLVWHCGLHLMEVKTARGTLTTDEAEWHQTWRGPVYIVRSIEDALKVVGLR